MNEALAIERKLAAGLQAMQLSVDVVQLKKLTDYILLMEKWNKVYNLTAIRDPLDMVTLHVLDSLSVLTHVQHLQIKRLLDVGSGAGLPSIPLAICLPDIAVSAIDAVQKKTTFMRQVKGELALSNFHVEVGRVEALKSETKFDAIISRAFSEIDLFMQCTRHLMADDGVWLAMKGVVPKLEFEKAQVTPAQIIPLKVSQLEAERHLIVIKQKLN